MASSLDRQADKFETLAVDKQGEDKGKMRHCAYCLTSVPNEKVYLCGKCRRRAYCSKECQTADWSPKGEGQGHKIWCPLQCGEEDLDWEVGPVPGKGVGLIAKRPFLSKSRVMVDAYRGAFGHPQVRELIPLDEPELNTIKTLDKIGKHFLIWDNCKEITDSIVTLLRLSRANHSCDPNADFCSLKGLKVAVLFAEREIQTGEEICVTYRSLKSLDRIVPYEECRADLKDLWGIVCPHDCLCRNPEIERLCERGRKLQLETNKEAKTGSVEGVVEYCTLLLEHLEEINCGWMDKARTLHRAFKWGIIEECTFKLATECGRQWYEIAKCIFHPGDENIREYLQWLEDPSMLRTYLYYKDLVQFLALKKLNWFHFH